MNEILSVLTNTKRVRIVLNLIEYIDDLPKTAVTFRPSEAVDDPGYVDSRCLLFANTWEIPSRLASSKRRAINPNCDSPWRYSDIATRCDCGALLAGLNSHYDWFDGEHSEGCTPVQRHQTESLLWTKRKRILHSSVLSYRRPKYMCNRLAVTEKSLRHIRHQLNYDVESVKGRVRDDIVREIVPVLTDDFEHSEIAAIFDVHRSTVSRWSNEELTTA